MIHTRKEIQARKITLVAGQTTTITEYRTSPDKSWTAVFFSNTEGLNSIRLFQKQLGGGYGTKGEIEYTIGNFPNGDTITGTGACVISALANVTCELSYYFVNEVYSQQLPPLSRNFVINSSPAYTIIGYPPFGRNKLQILTPNQYTVRYRNSNNDVVITGVISSPTFYLVSQAFTIHPNDLQLELLNSVANQNFNILHF